MGSWETGLTTVSAALGVSAWCHHRRPWDVMKTLSSGDHLVIDFDCTQATEAIPDWAARDGHEVTDFHEKGDASWQITLRKG